MDFIKGFDRDQLIMMVYNLRRLMSIFDINTLKKRLKSFCLCFLGIYSQNRDDLRHLNFESVKFTSKQTPTFTSLKSRLMNNNKEKYKLIWGLCVNSRRSTLKK
jgi:hypothetical protein